MRYTEGRIPSQYAAMVFICTLAWVASLPVACIAGPCDEVKSPQQSTSVQLKQEVLESEGAQVDDVKVKPAELAKSENTGANLEPATAIDMEVLTARLKETKAIGLFTKLAIRNDVSDLMDDVKRYRKKSMLDSKIEEIRESFEGLLMKIVALLDDDPELSRDLYVGRESIWKSLLEVKV